MFDFMRRLIVYPSLKDNRETDKKLATLICISVSL